MSSSSGGGSFLDGHALQAGDRRVTARWVCIAMGSRLFVLPVQGLAGAAIYQRRRVRRSARPTGVELAQGFHRFGSEITVHREARR